MTIEDAYALGFCAALRDSGVSANNLVKMAKDESDLELNPTRTLDKAERKSLLAALPPERRKQIVEFLLEDLYGGDDKHYIVTAKDHDKSRGEYTYVPSEDRLFESAIQAARNERKRNFRARSRLMWLGF